MNNFGNIANAMASIKVTEDGGYAVPRDMLGKSSEYAQPVLDKPPGGSGSGKNKQLRKQREQQLAMQKGKCGRRGGRCQCQVMFLGASVPSLHPCLVGTSSLFLSMI